MKLFSYFIFSSLLNQPKPLCKNCENFIPVNENIFGKCLKFMKHDLVTGNFTYEYADICRVINNKCGETGKLYNEKE
jgi:hypothetical protein